MTDNEKRTNAKRLAWTIYRNADEVTIKRLALYLNYEVGQLKQDIHDLPSYIAELEEKLAEYESE